MENTIKLIVLSLILALTSCGRDEISNKINDPAKVASLMNEGLLLSSSVFTVNPDDVGVDSSITFSPNSGTAGIQAGVQMDNNITFNAPNGNVNAVGMRFGSSGPIYFVPINTGGATAGTATFPFQISADICNNLSSICHDIVCYEFAQTSSGQISAANIQDVAMLCGNCNEPSCADLVDMSDCLGYASGSIQSSLVGGSITGQSACGSTTTSVSTNSAQLIVTNAGSSGNVNLTSDYYTGGCSTCSGLQLTISGETYIAVNGSASWSGNTLSYSATLKTIPNVVSGGGSTYSVSGSINCQ